MMYQPHLLKPSPVPNSLSLILTLWIKECSWFYPKMLATIGGAPEATDILCLASKILNVNLIKIFPCLSLIVHKIEACILAI